jgi:hypothetical protein
VIYKDRSECKREIRRGVVRLTREKSLRSQQLGLFIASEKIVLDNP